MDDSDADENDTDIADHLQLQQWWVNERSSPDILPFQFERMLWTRGVEKMSLLLTIIYAFLYRCTVVENLLEMVNVQVC